jgi:hypothetical protein
LATKRNSAPVGAEIKPGCTQDFEGSAARLLHLRATIQQARVCFAIVHSVDDSWWHLAYFHSSSIYLGGSMAIDITVQNAIVGTTKEVALVDRSGAHVELTLLIGNEPPIHHAFAFSQGNVAVQLPNLKVGNHKCTLVVQAYKHKLSVNRSYDIRCQVGQTAVATAVGNIPTGRNNDVGVGDFVLTVQ